MGERAYLTPLMVLLRNARYQAASRQSSRRIATGHSSTLTATSTAVDTSGSVAQGSQNQNTTVKTTSSTATEGTQTSGACSDAHTLVSTAAGTEER